MKNEHSAGKKNQINWGEAYTERLNALNDTDCSFHFSFSNFEFAISHLLTQHFFEFVRAWQRSIQTIVCTWFRSIVTSWSVADSEHWALMMLCMYFFLLVDLIIEKVNFAKTNLVLISFLSTISFLIHNNLKVLPKAE